MWPTHFDSTIEVPMTRRQWPEEVKGVKLARPKGESDRSEQVRLAGLIRVERKRTRGVAGWGGAENRNSRREQRCDAPAKARKASHRSLPRRVSPRTSAIARCAWINSIVYFSRRILFHGLDFSILVLISAPLRSIPQLPLFATVPRLPIAKRVIHTVAPSDQAPRPTD